MSRFILLILCSWFSASFATATDAKLGAEVEWRAESTLGVVKIFGKGGKATGVGKIDEKGMVSGTFECDLSDFDTGNELRNDHMKVKYLDTTAHPKAVLALDPVKVSKDKFAWTGKLTLKGQTKPISGLASLSGNKLWAEFVVSLTDYPAIGIPQYGKITVAKDVTVIVRGIISK